MTRWSGNWEAPMADSNLLSLLGLCKRAGMLEIGEEPVEAAARAKDARVLFLASDAADNTVRRVRHFADAGACLWLRLPFTKEELGRALGRTSCAVTAVTDIGFAANIVHRLAQADPAQYTEAAEKLDIKAKRAAERKAELQAHRENIRRGRKKKHAAPAQPEHRETASAAPAKRALEGRSAGASAGKPFSRQSTGRTSGGHRPFRDERRRKPAGNRFSGSRPVKKGKGSKPSHPSREK